MDLNKLIFRTAREDDLPTIVRFLGVDEVSGSREKFSTELTKQHLEIFQKITNDKNNELIVAEYDSNVVATLQITYIPYLTGQGETRALIEAIMVCPNQRGKGIGSELMKWAIKRAKEKGCAIVQLTSNKVRDKAHNFYKNLGFVPTHDGFKMQLVSKSH